MGGLARGRGGRALALAVALAGGLSGCRTTAPVAPHAGSSALAITIDQRGVGDGIALVDDRRTIDVPADGSIDLAGIAPGLELASVLLDAALRPGSLRVAGCTRLDHVEAFAGGWLVGRTVDVTTVGGAALSGTVVEIGGPIAVLAFAEGENELPLDQVSLSSPPDAPASRIGDRIKIDVGRGPEVGVIRDLRIDSLALHDAAGVRHAIRFDAIASLRIPELPAVPTLRCRVRTARPGRQLVRLAYRTRTARWRAAYQVSAIDDATTSIQLTPRYAITLGGLGAGGGVPADVTLRVIPGDALERLGSVDADTDPDRVRALLRQARAEERAEPVVVWQGRLALAGAEDAITAFGPPSTRAARVRRLYRGAITGPGDAHERSWNGDSTAEVWRELVFERAATDIPGELRVALAGGGLVRSQVGAPAEGARLVRVPLAIDPELVGYRERVIHDDDALADELRFSVANRGAAPVRVLLEEPLRPIGRASVRFAAPVVGTLSSAAWQLELEVAPGGIARAAVMLQYPEEP